MHQLTPIQRGFMIPRVLFVSWVIFIAAGVMIGFGVKLALSSNSWAWGLLLGAFVCLCLLWQDLHTMPLGRLKGNPLQVIKFAFARALHRTVLEKPEVSITDKVLRVGQEFTTLYQQHFNQPVHLSQFTIALVFREELRQPAGEGEEVDTAESVIEIFERGDEDIPAGLFYDKGSFRIPEDGTSSFANQLKGSAIHSGKWLLKVHMEPAGLPVFKNEYEIFVGSEGASGGPQTIEEKGWWSHTRYRFADKSDQ